MAKAITPLLWETEAGEAQIQGLSKQFSETSLKINIERGLGVPSHISVIEPLASVSEALGSPAQYRREAGQRNWGKQIKVAWLL